MYIHTDARTYACVCSESMVHAVFFLCRLGLQSGDEPECIVPLSSLTKRQILAAFKELSRKVHPDKTSAPRAKEAMQQLNHAHSFLKEADLNQYCFELVKAAFSKKIKSKKDSRETVVQPNPKRHKADPTSKNKPEPTPKPKAEPAPKPKAEPAPKQKAEPAPKPKAEPAPKQKAEPAPKQKDEPTPETKDEPTPSHNPESTNEAQPESSSPLVEGVKE
jgi:outer membrane biosynthesis protein TonB